MAFLVSRIVRKETQTHQYSTGQSSPNGLTVILSRIFLQLVVISTHFKSYVYRSWCTFWSRLQASLHPIIASEKTPILFIWSSVVCCLETVNVDSVFSTCLILRKTCFACWIRGAVESVHEVQFHRYPPWCLRIFTVRDYIHMTELITSNECKYYRVVVVGGSWPQYNFQESNQTASSNDRTNGRTNEQTQIMQD